MTTVTLHYFALLREQRGQSSESLATAAERLQLNRRLVALRCDLPNLPDLAARHEQMAGGSPSGP
jgi:replicative superfamily II helicase